MTEKTKNDLYLSIIIPVYNDVDALRSFLPSVIDFCYELGQAIEIIVVDDGSQDEIPNLMQTFIKACQQAKTEQADWNVDLQLLKLSRNFGKESALTAGLTHSNGELVTMMDCDGKHPLDVLSKMIKMMRAQSHIDMIAAIRTNQKHTNFIQKLKSKIYNLALDSDYYDIRPNSDNFRLMNRKVVVALNSLPERQRYMKGLYSWVGFHTVFLPYNRKKPHSDQLSHRFTFKNKFKSNSSNSIISFSNKPLHWITRFGFLFFILAIFYTFYILIDNIFLTSSDNSPSLIVLSILLLAGIQFFSLGILGAYIGRLYDEIKDRPLYLIDKHLSSETSTEEDLKLPSFINSKKTHAKKNRAPSNQPTLKTDNSEEEINTTTAYSRRVKSISQFRNEATPLNSSFVENNNSIDKDNISLNQLEQLITEESSQLEFPELNDMDTETQN